LTQREPDPNSWTYDWLEWAKIRYSSPAFGWFHRTANRAAQPFGFRVMARMTPVDDRVMAVWLERDQPDMDMAHE
jgi:hypothetical protein